MDVCLIKLWARRAIDGIDFGCVIFYNFHFFVFAGKVVISCNTLTDSPDIYADIWHGLYAINYNSIYLW